MDEMRLDHLLVELGHAQTRSKAQALIKAGNVLVDGKPALKAGQTCTRQQKIEVVGEYCPYVSRGGLKLEKALRHFGVDPSGYICSDSGASTGGFTDCLLQKGAKKVYAIDVGTDQLVDKIRHDPRVVVMEQTNVRYLTPADMGEELDLSVVDVSFISLRLVLPAIKQLLKADRGQVLCLIKPQFEAGKENLSKKGVVRDAAIHKRVLDVFLSFAEELGFTVLGLTYSPVRGPEGNIEFLGHLSLEKRESIAVNTAAIVAAAHENLKV
jgi:23S rRNA (cytidine1920-2'-O)/16S rRNA (cytidine1409-2'-O)-methyltransferase